MYTFAHCISCEPIGCNTKSVLKEFEGVAKHLDSTQNKL